MWLKPRYVNKVLGKCLMDMNTLSDKNSYVAVCSRLKIEIGQRPLKRKQVLCIWIPQHRRTYLTHQSNTIWILKNFAIVFMITVFS